MQRVAFAPVPAQSPLLGPPWLARRWYLTPTTRRTYSVRQVSPGDRRLLAEFVLALGAPAEVDHPQAALSSLLFDRVIVSGNRAMQSLAMSMGFTVEPLPEDRKRRRLVLSLK